VDRDGEEVLMYTILYLNGLMTLNVVPLVSLSTVSFWTDCDVHDLCLRVQGGKYCV
jgi:hypothetical protein